MSVWMVYKRRGGKMGLSVSPFCDEPAFRGLAASMQIPDGLDDDAFLAFEREAFGLLRQEILCQAADRGLALADIRFAYEEGFGMLDPAMPYRQVIRMLNFLASDNGGARAVRWMKAGELDSADFPYGRLYRYVCERDGRGLRSP